MNQQPKDSRPPTRLIALIVTGLLAACEADVSSSRPLAGQRVGTASSAVSTSAVTYAGDELRTGWYNDEAALDPATVGGGSFGQLFSTSISGQVYAQPLVSQGTLLVVTEANTIYGLNAVTGAQNWSRTLGAPFGGASPFCFRARLERGLIYEIHLMERCRLAC